MNLAANAGRESRISIHTMPAPKAGIPATGDDESTVRGRVVARDGIGWNRTTITLSWSDFLALRMTWDGF